MASLKRKKDGGGDADTTDDTDETFARRSRGGFSDLGKIIRRPSWIAPKTRPIPDGTYRKGSMIGGASPYDTQRTLFSVFVTMVEK